MKTILAILPLLIVLSCQRPHPIDEMFPWPSSGIPEADSLILQFERERTSIGIIRHTEAIAGRFRSIADRNPENVLLHMRNTYLTACMNYGIDNDSVKEMVEEAMNIEGASDFDYDWHMLNSMRAECEKDIAKRYDMTFENIEYFKECKSGLEEGRNLVVMGNIMYDIYDSLAALDYYSRAERICSRLDLTGARSITRLNIANISSPRQKDSLFSLMLNDPDVIIDSRTYALVLQDYFTLNDSLPLIDLAIKTLTDNDIEKNNLPMVLALKGHYHTRHGNPELGLKNIMAAFELTGEIEMEPKYMQTMHNFMADTYYHLGEKDSCIEELDRARILNQLVAQRSNGAGVYANDVKARIKMAEDNAKLKRWRIVTLWIISLLVIVLGGAFVIFRFKRRALKQKFEARLLEEKLEKNRQSLRAQASVMEESDRLIDELGKKIEEMKGNREINSESADKLARFLKIYKGNEENRNGFLRLNQEIDSRFITRLKTDFPALTESQLKLASLIAAGVDSRQICAILNIEQASVHKSRYRLRSRLGLSKEESLEDFLRKYNRTIPDE